MASIQKIVPCLWFDNQAEDAAKFYVSVFEAGSRIKRVSRYTSEGMEIHGREAGSVMTVEFELAGTSLTALNGGPRFQFNEAVSLQIMCETQPEIDRFWEKLGAGGDPKAQQCGWLKDKFGLSWQIFPTILAELMAADEAKASLTMRAMLQMKKLDIEKLKHPHGG
jgi:predicted 3-demethylubiquinone-9 3-methyltransferase (glyoxalase superfamily)